MGKGLPILSEQERIPWYRDERVLQWIAQIVSTVLVVAGLYWAYTNFLNATEARGLSLSFDFLRLEAGFPISDPGIPYDPSMTYQRAFLVGLVNTLRVAVVGILLATLLGTLVALARLSPNWLLSKLALAYIEFHRNIPLLVLLFLWYTSVFTRLPRVAEAINYRDMLFLSNRGMFVAWPRATETGYIFLWFFLAGVILALVAYFGLRKRREVTGHETYFGWVSLAILIGAPVIGWFAAGGQPFYLDIPVKEGFNFQGGNSITPEFAGLFVGITMYTAGFIAEVVRAGIQAVDRGQMEAARAIGLNSGQVLSLVVMPQALRVIIPPMISQYLNLTKNTSLALAIGYQDLFSVGKIAINQSGRAVPSIIIVMAVYLFLSLFTSFVLNLYNSRIQLVTR
jgi:general L-amino acid transport system permease protein